MRLLHLTELTILNFTYQGTWVNAHVGHKLMGENRVFDVAHIYLEWNFFSSFEGKCRKAGEGFAASMRHLVEREEGGGFREKRPPTTKTANSTSFFMLNLKSILLLSKYYRDMECIGCLAASFFSSTTLTQIQDPLLVISELRGTFELSFSYNVTIDCLSSDMVATTTTDKINTGKIYAKDNPNSCVVDVDEDMEFSIGMAYNDLECNMKREALGVHTNQVGLLALNF